MEKVNKEDIEEIRRQLQTTSNDPNLTMVLVHQFDFKWDKNGKPVIVNEDLDHEIHYPKQER